MNEDDKVIETLSKSIVSVMQSQENNMPYDKTVTGIVQTILPNNKYTVLVEGSTYDLIGNPDSPYTVGQKIDVIIPCNDYDRIRVASSGASGGGGSVVETDPTVPSWAKQPSKPTYTPSEIGAEPSNSSIVKDSAYVHTDNNFTTVYKNKVDSTATDLSTETTNRTNADISLQTQINTNNTAIDGLQNNKADKTSVPTKTSQLTNDSTFQTKTQLDTAIASYLLSYYTETEIDTLLANKSNLVGGKIPISELPTNLIAQTYNVTILNDLATLTQAEVGDFGRVTSFSPPKVYVLTNTPVTDLNNWLDITNQGGVISVNGLTGAVTLNIANIPNLSNELNSKYSATNTPPYPVTLVNGKSGNVTIAIADISGLQAAIDGKLSTNGDSSNTTVTFTDSASLVDITTGEKISVAFGKISKAITDLISHIANASNPHSTTKTQVGLGNVDNTSDVNKPISTATQTALNAKLATTGDASNTTNAFTVATSRSNLTTGEKTSVSLGKILKWFTDLKALAFKDKVSKTDLDTALITELDGKTNTGHTHTKSNITDFPTIPTNSSFALSGLNDVTVTTPTSGQLLSWNGSRWMNANPQTSSQTQTDWNVTDTASVAYIKNKPTSLPANGGNADTLDSLDSTYFMNIQSTNVQPTNQRTNDIWIEEL